MDDQYVPVPQVPLRIVGLKESPNLFSNWDEPCAVPIRHGAYDIRRDDFGQPVPHSVSQIMEADWQGWE